MASAERKGYERFLEKEVKVIFYDGPEHATSKYGKVVSIGEDAIIIFDKSIQKELLIPKARIVRIECMEGKNGRGKKRDYTHRFS